MAEDKVPSFEDFVSDSGLAPRGKCAVCKLPLEVRQQLQVAHDGGYRAVSMSRYLYSIGHEVSTSSLSNHMNRNHPWA